MCKNINVRLRSVERTLDTGALSAHQKLADYLATVVPYRITYWVFCASDTCQTQAKPICKNVDNVVTLSHLKFKLERLEADREEEKARYQDKIAGMEAQLHEESQRANEDLASKSIAHAQSGVYHVPKSSQIWTSSTFFPQENAQEGSHRVAQNERGSWKCWKWKRCSFARHLRFHFTLGISHRHSIRWVCAYIICKWFDTIKVTVISPSESSHGYTASPLHIH